MRERVKIDSTHKKPMRTASFENVGEVSTILTAARISPNKIRRCMGGGERPSDLAVAFPVAYRNEASPTKVQERG